MPSDAKLQLSIKDMILVPGNRLISYGYQKGDEILVEEVIVALIVTVNPRKTFLKARLITLWRVVSPFLPYF